MTKNVVVIGAGIAGIQVAQQLTDLGLVVHLVEKEATIGGLSSYLGRVFPTGDCALCLDASTELFDGHHRRCQYRSLLTEKKNLKLYTQSEVESIERDENRFSVSISISPRYILLDRCVVCLECVDICEVEVPDEFGVRNGTRKAVYRPIPQGVPLAPLIDIEHCTRCGKCIEVCEVNAIDFEQKQKKKTIKADAIVLATGVDERSPSNLPGYIYDSSEDIMTQRELARLIDPAGSTNGKIITAAGKPVESVTMIMCAGSRDLNAIPYCSQACCTYTLKHANMLRLMSIEVTACYMDLRVPYASKHILEEARELGVKFIRGKPDHVSIRDGHLVTIVEDTQKQSRCELKSDLVVLASPLIPHNFQNHIFTEYVDQHGFVKESDKSPLIYACGTATKPTDIPTSITQANEIALQVYTAIRGGN
jgi:heterodisulfide reductase subunit A-like polyferredoxin